MSHSKLIKFKDKRGNVYPYLFIDELTGIFYLKKWFDDKTRTYSLETKDFNTARNLIAEKIIYISKLEPGKPLRNKIIKDYYDLMMKHKEAEGIKPTTKNRIEIIWKKSLKPYWEYVLPEDLNQELISDFVTWHKRKRPGIQLINVFKYLGNIFNVMVETGDFAANKVPKLEIPKDEQRHHASAKGRYVTDHEVQDLLRHSEPWLKIQILMSYTTGMRKMEIGALEVARLKRVKDHYVINLETKDTKTGRARVFPLAASLTSFIDAQIVMARDSKYLFPMKSNRGRFMSSQLIDKYWFEAKREAGIKTRLRFHDLRHTCATNMAKMNINPAVACAVLGMSLEIYQRTYLKLSVNDLMIAVEATSQRLPKGVFQ